ncbi:MAG: HEAT repeat domain-containing protein [Planctomycetota bacterium]|nr:HEAT repeat domain-containing protein [Planctomycetota bacterium]
MPTLPDIFLRVGGVEDASVDQALAAALPTADPRAQALIVQTILSRIAEEGRVALVQSFHTLPRDLQLSLARHGQALYPAMTRVTAGRQSRGQMNVANLVRAAGDPRLAGLLTDLLRHGDAAVQPVAAEGLLELATACREASLRAGTSPRTASRTESEIEPHGATGTPASASARANARAVDHQDILLLPASTIALQGAIDEALAIFHHHRQTAVLQALLLMSPRPMPLAMRIMSDRAHPAVTPVREMLAKADSAAARRAATALARLPGLAAGALAGILRAAATGRLPDVIAGGAHLLAAGPVSRALAHLPDPGRACPAAGDVAAYPPALAPLAAAWIAGLPLEPGQKIAALASYSRAAHPSARLAALRRLLALGHDREPAALDAVAAFCADPDTAIARIALRHLIRTRWQGLPRLLLGLVHAPDPGIRHLAASHLAPLGFQRFWDAWPKLDHARQLAAGRALIKLDASFPRLLGERLTHPERPSALRALSIIHTLNQGSLFEQPLVALSRSADEVVAASAVRAMGSAESEESLHAIEGALNHHDSRVRANAVEALEQRQSTRHIKKLLAMAETDDNRPRANAIHALMQMRTSDALGALSRMLDDPQAPHRVSALWLVDQLGLVQVARHVAEMSITDPDRNVKQLANTVIHHLIDAMRLATEPHPPAPAPPAPAAKAG